jgi:hypothetical protein
MPWTAAPQRAAHHRLARQPTPERAPPDRVRAGVALPPLGQHPDIHDAPHVAPRVGAAGGRTASGDGLASPWKRGLASGIMRASGSAGHAPPDPLLRFWMATAVAIDFVAFGAIAWIQNRCLETPMGRAVFQVVLGRGLVPAAGILIGNG